MFIDAREKERERLLLECRRGQLDATKEKLEGKEWKPTKCFLTM